MTWLTEFANRFVAQLQSPTLSFLIGGALIAAWGSKLTIPNAIYQFIVFILLMKIGMKGGIEIREADLGEMLLPAVFAILIGVGIVLLGNFIFSRIQKVKTEDGTATAGLFGAVSASTLAAAMVLLEEQEIMFEAWVPALYPFMDIPALIMAILLAQAHKEKSEIGKEHKVNFLKIIKGCLQGAALSALLLGLALGIFARPDKVLESFYNPLFRGLLSVLMLILGMEAYSRLRELKSVAHWFAIYALTAPIVHGVIGFALGYIAHLLVGFSPGGVVLLAVIAASNSDISGPPTIRGGIPHANPSAYIGASTSIGTPVAIAICIPLFVSLAEVVFAL
jgi:hypothetical protein